MRFARCTLILSVAFAVRAPIHAQHVPVIDSIPTTVPMPSVRIIQPLPAAGFALADPLTRPMLRARPAQQGTRARRQSQAIGYMGVGAFVGMVAGIGYGIKQSEVGEGLTGFIAPMISIPLFMAAGTMGGALLGGLVWKATHPGG